MNRLRAPYVKPISKRFVNWTYGEPKHPYPELDLEKEIMEAMAELSDKIDREIFERLRGLK